MTLLVRGLGLTYVARRSKLRRNGIQIRSPALLARHHSDNGQPLSTCG